MAERNVYECPVFRFIKEFGTPQAVANCPDCKVPMVYQGAKED